MCNREPQSNVYQGCVVNLNAFPTHATRPASVFSRGVIVSAAKPSDKDASAYGDRDDDGEEVEGGDDGCWLEADELISYLCD
jgi:hypothetical protein